MATLTAGLHVNWGRRDTVIACGAVLLMETVHLLQRRGSLSRVIIETPGWVRWAGYYALALAILMWAPSDSHQFIYAEF